MMLAEMTTEDLKAELERREVERRSASKRFTMEDGCICGFSCVDEEVHISLYGSEDEFAHDEAYEYFNFELEDLPKLISTARAFQSVVGA